MKTAAIVLAGGSGSRMKSSVKKQYMLIGQKPVLYYSLRVFQSSDIIDEIVLVCGAEEIENCRKEITQRYGFTKVKKIVAGGKERYHSVYEGLKAVPDCDYVMIHDGARPFVDEDMLERIWKELPKVRACTVGMMVKDTIKMSDEQGYISETLPREKLWSIQTPQAFEYRFIREIHDQVANGAQLSQKITDDAMLAEYIGKIKVKLIEGSYQNIKITTPEDILFAEAILRQKEAEKPAF